MLFEPNVREEREKLVGNSNLNFSTFSSVFESESLSTVKEGMKRGDRRTIDRSLTASFSYTFCVLMEKRIGG